MFDTHKAVKALKQAGFDDSQAEAVVATVGDAIGENVATKGDTLALKADIGELRTDFSGLRSEFADFKTEITTDIAEFKTDIADFKAEIYRHLWLMGAGIVGLTVTLVKLIP